MSHQEQTLGLSGELIFSRVEQVRSSFLNKIKLSEDKHLVIDLSGVIRTDTAGLALMVEGIKAAKLLGKELKYHSAPESLLKLARFCRLEDILCPTM